MHSMRSVLSSIAEFSPALGDEVLALLLMQTERGIWIVDAQGCGVFANDQVGRMLDRPPMELQRQPVAQHVVAADTEALQNLLAHGHIDPHGDTLKFKAANGMSRWTHTRCHRLSHSPAGHQLLLISDNFEHDLGQADLSGSEYVFRSHFEHGNIGMCLTSPDKGWIRVNARLCDMLGYSERELKQLTWAELTHPDDLEDDITQFSRMLRGEISGYELDKRFIRKDGTELYTHLTTSFYRRGPGPTDYVIASLQDITESKRTEAALRQAACVFANSQEGIMIIDAQRRIVDVNPAFSTITGHSRTAALGQSVEDLLLAPGQAATMQSMQRAMATTGRWQGEIECLRHVSQHPSLRSSQHMSLRMSIDAVRNEHAAPARYACVFSDISQSLALQRELDRIAHFDMLTGVPNRRLLSERLEAALAHARRTHTKLAVCYIDLDGFKPINDSHGHAIGDLVLAEVAQRLMQHVRGNLIWSPSDGTQADPTQRRQADTVARLGGDEFVLLLGDLLDAPQCEQTLQRVLNLMLQPLRADNVEINISASIGVTLYPDDNVDADTLLRHADHAMYQAKEMGKGRVQMFDAHQSQRQRLQRESLLRLERGLRAGELCLHYQPKVNMRRGTVIGVEALIRWNHPAQGLRLPASFLPLVEDHELDTEIGRWVITEAVAQAARWLDQDHCLPISINISARHLQSADFASFLVSTLQRHPRVVAEHIILEIVETTAINDMDRVCAILRHCRELGFQFALDDFGTGYSSLTLLRKLPVQELKIDQSFIRDILADPNDMAITRGIVALARAFHCELVAEGVATEAHGLRLLSLGCDCAQGMGIASPMEAAAVLPWCRSWQPPKTWSRAALLVD